VCINDIIIIISNDSIINVKVLCVLLCVCVCVLLLLLLLLMCVCIISNINEILLLCVY